MWAGIHFFLDMNFSHTFLLTEEFAGYNLFYKLGLMWLSVEGVKARYYFVFKLAESGAIASGYAYEGKVKVGEKEVESFKRTNMMITYQIELGPTPKHIIDGWNV
jgi:hypothetical protein